MVFLAGLTYRQTKNIYQMIIGIGNFYKLKKIIRLSWIAADKFTLTHDGFTSRTDISNYLLALILKILNSLVQQGYTAASQNQNILTRPSYLKESLAKYFQFKMSKMFSNLNSIYKKNYAFSISGKGLKPLIKF